jgi:hypothetical protein
MSSLPTDAGARKRRNRLLLASVATLAATVWTASQSDDSAPGPARARAAVEPAGRDAAARSQPALAPAPAPAAATAAWPEPPSLAQRQAWRHALPQSLAAWSAPVPPPPPAPTPAQAAAAQAAAQAQAPRFAYALIGRLDDGVPQVLLQGRLRSFGAKAGDVIDGQWRVDAVQSQGIALTWLPGNQKQTLAFSPS